MKKLICLFTILAFLGVANSMAQGLHFGLKAGVLGNKANVSGMRNQFKEESLTGFQVGPMLQYQTGFHGIALDFSLLTIGMMTMMTMMTTNTFHHISVTLHLLKKNKANPPPVFRAASWGGQTYETLPYRPSTSHHA